MSQSQKLWTVGWALLAAVLLGACDRSAPPISLETPAAATAAGAAKTAQATAVVAAQTAAVATAQPSTTVAAAAPTGAPAASATATTKAATRAPTRAPTVAPTAAPPSATATRAALNMRAVDWMQVVTTDPNLQYDASVAPPPGVQHGPWVQLKSNSAAQGHALVDPDNIVFADISGDGQEEAIISLFSGGTAGDLGLLVYTAANGAPVLADALAGYKIGGTAGGGRLKVTEPIYQGWEPNCCPSGFFITLYQLKANKLAQLSRDEQPIPEARRMTVDHFYELLQARNYSEAYDNFLSAAYHTDHPFGNWSGGYANTLSFVATTADNPDGSVTVDLVAHNKSGSGEVVRHYKGAWHLRWQSTARFKQWVLDSASFIEVP